MHFAAGHAKWLILSNNDRQYSVYGQIFELSISQKRLQLARIEPLIENFGKRRT